MPRLSLSCVGACERGLSAHDIMASPAICPGFLCNGGNLRRGHCLAGAELTKRSRPPPTAARADRLAKEGMKRTRTASAAMGNGMTRVRVLR